ncbi:mucoidy inhibitor MuiA family protein [Tolypothrix sp. FACHB-123]|nr:mucoidy inhibitor MuiA family protein [Tolypothrix sp. FACHB-123]MBD2358807.1 mucoidy inhibitor MuiA family protein [Tolypothrix sp. FACHB-123]
MDNPQTSSLRQTVESQILAVTVYSDRALVTRQARVSLTGEEKELVLTSLPVTLETDSVRVSGKGTVGVRLLGVSSDRIYTTKPVGERIAQLTRQIQQLETEQRHLQAQIDALALQSSFIAGLREKIEEPFAQSLSRKNLSLSETLDFINFLGSQYGEYAIASGECKTQQDELKKQLQVLRTSLQKIQTPHPQESASLIIAVEVAGAGDFELEVSYVVNRASWTPFYDLRLSNTSNIVNLTYLAEVTQSTGEDWLGVDLTLSTAKPGLGTLPPRLEPWYINAHSLPPVEFMSRRATQMPMMAQAATRGIEEAEEEVTQESPIEAEIVAAEVSQAGSVVTFKLNGNGNIPSDGAPHKTTIFNDDYPSSCDYIAIPRLVTFAYLQAKVKNSVNGATLLPGKANVFRDNMFVGTNNLGHIAPGQEFKINLGIDEGLKIERDLVTRQVDKKMMSSQRRITYGYRLIITNLLDKEARLILTEQLPVSRNEQLKIRLTRTNPQIQLGEMGMLEWDLTLLAEEKREINYQFTVEYPPDLIVTGLDI